jgi:phage baseplate assembly protein gpV
MADALVQIGTVQAVNRPAGTVTVLHEDAGTNGSVSTDLPILRPKRPEIGDPVLCVYLSNGAAYGLCLGVHYVEETPPPDDGNIIEVFTFPNGDSIQYDTSTNGLNFNISGPVTINGKVFSTHQHSGVQTGGGETGGVA